ncbi:MAG TPA: helix-turn-helix transcriptional regulator, partial [Bacteroidia bacterium]|nr:helix-turn-helix transcriptional regulator [Bacteroidia bacterium]
IGRALKELRIKNGWTSYETFAVENDIDRKQYWRMEAGTNITLKTLLKVLSVHKLTLKQFFNDNKV